MSLGSFLFFMEDPAFTLGAAAAAEHDVGGWMAELLDGDEDDTLEAGREEDAEASIVWAD